LYEFEINHKFQSFRRDFCCENTKPGAMKKITLTSLIIILTTILSGQKIKISVAPTINNALYYHFTAGGPGHIFKPGFSTSLEYILQNDKRINYGFGLSYQFCQIGYTPNMNTGDFIGQTDRVNLISINLISVYNLRKNFYLSFIPLIDFHLNYDSENIIENQSGCGLSFSVGKLIKLNDRIILNLEPRLWIHNIVPLNSEHLTVAGLNIGFVFGHKEKLTLWK
jgi:hypothetical protein